MERAEPFEIEYRVPAREGKIVWLAARGVPMRGGSGRVSRIIGVCQDITERKRREEMVHFLAYHDALTGLPNRRLLDDRLKQAVYQAQRRDARIAAMLVDLDDFKQVNDTAGHRAGDAVLREVAKRLGACVRKADTVARHGGDEFVILMADVHERADCQIVAEKILDALAAEFRIDGAAYKLGASIGISLFPSDAGDAEALLRNADVAMYRAKQFGKNQFRFYGR
jgi:diguanylate cyclase (GGDEF)-like protein